MTARRLVGVVLLGILAWLDGGVAAGDPANRHAGAAVERLLGLDVRPVAIAHRGFGQNLGEDPSRPIENTVTGVLMGFIAGARVVEVDVQLTRDGEVAAFHDDVLPDGTCLNQLTLAELQQRLPHVPALREILEVVKRRQPASGPARGLLIVELKPAAPRCDPDDTQERAIVGAATRVIRRAGMSRQVLVTSFSPALLFLAQQHAPDIVRILAVSGLQFLTAEQVAQVLGAPVLLIDKDLALGLQWAEIGDQHRLPGYGSLLELLRIAMLTGARVVETDLAFLSTAGAPAVQALQAHGLEVFGFTATTPAEWLFLESLGVDGIYTNDVVFGVLHQAPLLLSIPPRPHRTFVPALSPRTR